MSLFTSYRNGRNSLFTLSRNLFVPTPFKSSSTIQNAAFGGVSTGKIARTSISQLSKMRMSTQVEPDVDSDTTAEELFGFDLPTNDNNPNLLKVRHTTNHIMAMAVQRLHPEAQVTIGPWIDQGFYYDFFFPEKKLSDTDLKAIKKEMDKIIKANLPIRREEVTREEARSRIQALNEPYKLEILDGIKTEPITIYHVGDQWWDLCAGPHVESTGELEARAIELQSVAGAYWRGDETKPMLQV
jgi:threonyl-tRNA synthetase